MKNIIFLAFFFLSIWSLKAQSLYSYTAFNGTKYSMNVVEKKNIVLLYPSEKVIESMVALDSVASIVDRMYEYYKKTMGFEPSGGLSLYLNKCPVAFVNETCGAACGLIGSKGIEVGLLYLDEITNEFIEKSSYSRIGIVSYEFGRNFFSYKISSKLSFSNNQNTFANGFATFMGIRAAFSSGAIPKSRRFLNETQYWNKELYSQFVSFLVRPNISASDLYINNKIIADGYRIPRGSTGIFKDAGLFVFLDSVFRDNGIFPAFWENLQKQPNGTTNQQVFDNIAIATSLATNFDLSDFFSTLLKFPISANAINQISNLPKPQSKILLHDITNFNIVNLEDSISFLTSTLRPKEPNSYNRILIKLKDQLIFKDSTVNTSYNIPIKKCFSQCLNSEDRTVLIQSISDNQLLDTYTINLHYWDTISTSSNLLRFAENCFMYSEVKTGSATIDLNNNSIQISTKGVKADDNMLYYNFRAIKNHTYKLSAMIKASPESSILMGCGGGFGSGYIEPKPLPNSSSFHLVQMTFSAKDLMNNEDLYYKSGEELRIWVGISHKTNVGAQFGLFKDISFIDVTASFVEWNQKPTPPVIMLDQGNLKSSYPTGNQWYLNDELIAGATNQYYIPQKSGEYRVSATSGLCISDLSNPYKFTLTSVSDQNTNNEFFVYPNPVDNYLTIQTKDIVGLISIYDIIGRCITEQQIAHQVTQIDVSNFAKGTYIVKFNSFKQNNSIKFVKD
jgi:hypothetical protein